MEAARIKEGKIVLLVGILYVIIFFFFGVVFMVAAWVKDGALAAVYPMIIFLLFIFPGMALILSYYRREIVFYDSCFIVRRTFGKERQYSYSEADCIIAMKTRSEVRYILFGRQEGKRLAVFDDKSGKKQSRYVSQIPCAGAMISGLMLIVFINTLNSNGKDFFIFSGILWILLLLPFAIKMAVIRRRERKGRIAAIVVAAFVIAFVLVDPINYVGTFQEPVHEDMTVSDKEISSSKSGTHYYLYGEWKGAETMFKVSKSIYKEAEKGDRMRVCIRTSIFGYSYWTVHK